MESFPAITGSTVVVFPGQGSQRPGMGIDFLEAYPVAAAVFERACEALAFDVAAVCRSEDERLHLTEFTQPCILTVETAMHEVLKAEFGFSAETFGGHSLGEYSALVAARAIPFEIALPLVRLRGALMQGAVPVGQGGMIAVIMPDLPRREITMLAAAEGLDVANDNSHSQLVLSGSAVGCDRVTQALEDGGYPGLRVVRLAVSAPFHSKAMAGIEIAYGEALAGVSDCFSPERAKVVTSNYTGAFHSGRSADLLEGLTRQISGTVRWRDNMAALSAVGGNVIEIGPGRPLRAFFEEVGVHCESITSLRSAERLFAGVAV